MCEKCDPIVKEVRKFRHAADPMRICEQDRLSGRRFVSYASEVYNPIVAKAQFAWRREILYGGNSKYF